MELQEQVEKYCVTKVELMTFREETAINFGRMREENAVNFGRMREENATTFGKIREENAVNLGKIREESAVNFGKVHEAIAQLYVENEKTRAKVAEMEARLIRWFVGTAIAIAGSSFAIARYFS